MSKAGRPGGRRRVRRFLERTVLAAMMSVVAFVVERQLLKAVRKKGERTREPPSRVLTATPDRVPDEPER
ncbi:MAG: hypothetical protein HY658_14770 [Actinobacteria bacterium]|nr:hypothetical protein [Actinomycetota bacterium]